MLGAAPRRAAVLNNGLQHVRRDAKPVGLIGIRVLKQGLHIPASVYRHPRTAKQVPSIIGSRHVEKIICHSLSEITEFAAEGTLRAVARSG